MKNLFKFRYALIVSAVALLSAGCVNQVTAPLTNDQSISTPANNNAQDSTIRYPGQDGKTALDLLKAGHQVTTKTYSGVGEFVQSIDGKTPDSTHFWAFYLNGKSSDVGAGQYVTKSSDQIEWRLEEIKQ